MNIYIKGKSWFPIGLAAAVVMFIGGPKLSHAKDDGSRAASKRKQEALFSRLLPIVNASGKAFRLYYRSDCSAGTDSSFAAVPFPSVKLQSPAKDKKGVDAVRSIFRDDKNVSVAEDQQGIIRIYIGTVPTSVLQTKLPSLRLNAMAQYNPPEVFNLIIETNEMKLAMDSLKFSPVPDISSTRAPPDPKFPHLPDTIKNLTAEQVLDKIAQTWAGRVTVIYGTCSEPDKNEGDTLFWFGLAGQN